MKSVRLHSYGKDPSIDEVAEPTVTGPWDVVVDVGAAGVCRTDLHIIEGQWDAIQHPSLPYILGHENAGWVSAVGSAVHNVKPGDTVIITRSPAAASAPPAASARTRTVRTPASPASTRTAAWRSSCSPTPAPS